MKTLKQLELEREELDKQIEELKEQEAQKIKEENKQINPIDIIHFKGKEYRIYEWENKPFKDFPIPKGYRWATGIELVELINESNYNFEKIKSYYAAKLFEKSYWDLFGAYLDGDGWLAVDGYLPGSDDCGRVVLREVKK